METVEMKPKVKAAKYPAYKESGVEWLGRIPGEWDVVSLGSLIELKSDKNHPDYEVLSVYREYGVIKKDSRDDNHNVTSENKETYKAVEPGDLVVNKMKAWQGSMGISPYRGIVSPAYITCKVTSSRVKSAYLHLLLRCNSYIGEYNRLSYGVRVGQWDMHYEDLKKVPVLLPPPAEQTHIAEFLDKKTAQIDQAIAQKERQIELLKERRQILIHNAVTRGLNPNVKMKDSGVEWIGEIPEHWEVLFNRRLFREHSRKITEQHELPLSLSQVDGLIPSNDLKERSLSPAHRDNFKLCYPGDLVVNRFKGHLGVFFESKFRGIVTFHYGVFEPEKEVHTKYFEFLFHTEEYKTIYAGASNGMTIGLQNLSNQKFYDVRSIVPTYDEQKAIVQYCETVIDKTSLPIRCKENEIEKLKEYKATLINAAVTGKIKV